MRCPYCGGFNPDNKNFCIRCGRDLVASTPNPTAQRPAQPTRPTQNQPAQPTRPTQNQPAQQQTAYQAPYKPTPPPGGSRPSLPAQPPASYPPPPTQYTQRPAYPPNPPGKAPLTTAPRPGAPPAPIPATLVAKNVAIDSTTGKRASTDTNSIHSSLAGLDEAPVPFPPTTRQQLEMLMQGALPYTLVNDTEGYGKKKIVRIAYRQCAGWQQVGTLLKALKEYNEPAFDTLVIQGAFEQDKSIYHYTNGQLIFDRNVRLGSLVQNRYHIETGNGLSSDSVRFVVSE